MKDAEEAGPVKAHQCVVCGEPITDERLATFSIGNNYPRVGCHLDCKDVASRVSKAKNWRILPDGPLRRLYATFDMDSAEKQGTYTTKQSANDGYYVDGPLPPGTIVMVRHYVDAMHDAGMCNLAYAAGRSSRDAEVERLRQQLGKIAALQVPNLPKKAEDREIALGAIFGVAVMLAFNALSTDPGGTMGGEGK